jgi:hypothetical protein
MLTVNMIGDGLLGGHDWDKKLLEEYVVELGKLGLDIMNPKKLGSMYHTLLHEFRCAKELLSKQSSVCCTALYRRMHLIRMIITVRFFYTIQKSYLVINHTKLYFVLIIEIRPPYLFPMPSLIRRPTHGSH